MTMRGDLARCDITRMLLVPVIAVVLLAVACGDGGSDSSAAARKPVQVNMVDSAYRPPAVQVERGDEVEFAFSNKGSVPHDAFIGDAAQQAEHEKAMRAGAANGGGHGGHGDDTEDAVTVDPGRTGSLSHTFDEAGTFEVGCHQPGHYAAGMKIIVTVT